MDMKMENEELNLSLSLHPSYPLKLSTEFSCCYCPKKFRSSQALGGHQDAHKLHHNLARRSPEVCTGAISQRKGEIAGAKDRSSALSAEFVCRVSSGKKHHEEFWQVQQASSGSSSGTTIQKATEQGVDDEDVANEMIDVSLKL